MATKAPVPVPLVTTNRREDPDWPGWYLVDVLCRVCGQASSIHEPYAADVPPVLDHYRQVEEPELEAGEPVLDPYGQPVVNVRRVAVLRAGSLAWECALPILDQKGEPVKRDGIVVRCNTVNQIKGLEPEQPQ